MGPDPIESPLKFCATSIEPPGVDVRRPIARHNGNIGWFGARLEFLEPGRDERWGLPGAKIPIDLRRSVVLLSAVVVWSLAEAPLILVTPGLPPAGREGPAEAPERPAASAGLLSGATRPSRLPHASVQSETIKEPAQSHSEEFFLGSVV